MWRRKTPDENAFDSWRLIEQAVRPDFRKTVAYGLIALVALIVGPEIGGVRADAIEIRLIAFGCVVVVAFFGAASSRAAAREVHRIASARAGAVAATPLRLIVLLGGYGIAAIAVFDMLGLQLRNLLVGGAITGVVLGLAAQPVLGNLFAGLVLMFARPYVPGQRVRVMSGALNGPHYGTIVSAGLLYTVLETDIGPLNIPNSQLLLSAVGPSDKSDEPETSPGPDDGVPPADDYGSAVAGALAGDAADASADQSGRRAGGDA